MIYIPALLIGFVFFYLLNYAFYFSGKYSPIIDYLHATPNLNENSNEYWLLGLHDALLFIIASICLLAIYKYVLIKLPFNLLAIGLMQFPTVLFNAILSATLFNFSSPYYSSTSIVNIITFIAMPLIYLVMRERVT